MNKYIFAVIVLVSGSLCAMHGEENVPFPIAGQPLVPFGRFTQQQLQQLHAHAVPGQVGVSHHLHAQLLARRVIAEAMRRGIYDADYGLQAD